MSHLDVIISVGYHLKSIEGILFRIWAGKRLKKYVSQVFPGMMNA
ncbi:MAG: virulence RhuM family protein [Bacteroidales bacterium]|nr:virulence RhuM family protein [Bacteroidales bacterium]